MDRRAAASEATRLRILEATVALHGERGAAATRWTDIAERADVAIGTVYRYFPGYDELIPACTGFGTARLKPPTPEIFGRATSVGGRVTALVRESFSYWERANPWIQHSECDRRAIPAVEAFNRRQEARFEDLVRAALGPLARRRRVVDTTVVLSGFSSWAAYHARGVPTTESAAHVTELLAGWLGEAAMATRIADSSAQPLRRVNMATVEAMKLTVEPGESRGKSFHDGGIGVLFKIFGRETGDALAVVEHPIDPRRLVPPHTHADVDEYSYVLEGEIGARIGDRVISASRGTYVLKPRGIMHTFWNATDRPARILEILSPAKFERFFEEMGELVKSHSPETPEKLAALASVHGATMSMDWVAELKSAYGLKLVGEP